MKGFPGKAGHQQFGLLHAETFVSVCTIGRICLCLCRMEGWVGGDVAV